MDNLGNTQTDVIAVRSSYDQEALEAIERICGDDWCAEQDMLQLDREDGDLKTAIDKLGEIYILAHSHILSNVCYHVHDDWRAKAHPKKVPDTCACPSEHYEDVGPVCPVCGGKRGL